MLNSFKNLSRPADKIGNLHFISFLSAVLSRLAYLNDNLFLKNYCKIMDSVIPLEILTAINNVPADNIFQLLEDDNIFKLNDPNSQFKDYTYHYMNDSYIDFVELNMPQNVNIINGDLPGTFHNPILANIAPINTPPVNVKYISVGWSNYGEVYIVADKRMPNIIFLIFRGTYSAKTAALYSKPSSVIPLTVCNDSAGQPEQFLYGIFKATTEMIHTILEGIRYLATDFLGATQPNSVKIFTTGHSLGNAMCVDFAYLWMGIKKTPPYNNAPYNVLADNIICVGLGGPRCMGSSVAKKFCQFVSQKKILFLRITTRGDPVPALPPANPLYPKAGFVHPCSDDANMRKVVSEDCNALLTMRPTPNVNYNGNLDCQNYKTRIYAPNPLSHTIYLDILYTKAVDIVNFFKGIGISKEVLRTPTGSTVCRLVMGEYSRTKGISQNTYKVIFFDVNKAREIPTNTDAIEEKELSKVDPNAAAQLQTPDNSVPTNGGGLFSSLSTALKPKPAVATPTAIPVATPIATPTATAIPIATTMPAPNMTSSLTPKIGGKVSEDRRMTLQSFNNLIGQMVPMNNTDLCPQAGQMANPTTFTNEIMPDLSCPGSKFGGKRRRTTRRNKRRNKSRNRKIKRHVKTRRH